MQKTVKEWLDELPEPYRSQALENHEKYPFTYSAGKEVINMKSAIFDGFDWAKTEQGENYWREVYFNTENIQIEAPTPTERQTAEALLKEWTDFIDELHGGSTPSHKRHIADFLTSKYGKG